MPIKKTKESSEQDLVMTFYTAYGQLCEAANIDVESIF